MARVPPFDITIIVWLYEKEELMKTISVRTGRVAITLEVTTFISTLVTCAEKEGRPEIIVPFHDEILRTSKPLRYEWFGGGTMRKSAKREGEAYDMPDSLVGWRITL